jgi:hypothetical protein
MIRKIMSQEEKDKRDLRNRRIAGIILGLIMLLSTAGYFVFDFSSGNTKRTETFSGINFQQTDFGTWKFSYGGNEYETLLLPSDIANISFQANFGLSSYYNQPIYFSAETIEDISGSASQEIIKNLGNIVLRANFACLSDNCTQDYPIKNCSSDNILLFKKSQNNQTRIYSDGKCAVMEYSPGDEERIADAFLFNLMNIK